MGEAGPGLGGLGKGNRQLLPKGLSPSSQAPRSGWDGGQRLQVRSGRCQRLPRPWWGGGGRVRRGEQT